MDARKWLNEHIIFECRSGSHAYGLNTPESDEDFRGVCVAPIDYYLGSYKFEQYETKDPDRCIFDIRKFFKLAAENNPNIIELLYMSDGDIIKNTHFWEKICENKGLFLSKKAKFTYSGYAFAQLKRILTHRKWLLNPPTVKPKRVDFGLPEHGKLSPELIGAIDSVIRNAIQDELISSFSNAAEEIDKEYIINIFKYDIKETLENAFADFVIPEVINKLSYNIDLSFEVGTKFFSEEIMSIYNKEKRYRSANKHWDQYQTWLSSRNPKRAELEAKYGYDTKHASHIFRLLIQGAEILSSNNLTVKLRPEDKELCIGVKQGAFTYEKVLEMANSRMGTLDSLYDGSTLQHSADVGRVNDLLVSVISDYHRITR